MLIPYQITHVKNIWHNYDIAIVSFCSKKNYLMFDKLLNINMLEIIKLKALLLKLFN